MLTPIATRGIVLVTPEPTWTPSSPRPRPTPLGLAAAFDGAAPEARLGPGEMPRALYDALGPVPIVTGARWTYRVHHVMNDTLWSTNLFTRTVVESVPYGDGSMLVRLRSDRGPMSGTRAMWMDEHDPFPLEDLLLAVTPNGIHAVRDPDSLRATEVEQPLCVGHEPVDGPSTWLVPMPFPAATDERATPCPRMAPFQQFFWEDSGSVRVAAGAWDECIQLGEFGGAMHGQGHIYCSGVGFVKHSSVTLFSMAGYWAGLWDLIDYEIPPIVPVP